MDAVTHADIVSKLAHLGYSLPVQVAPLASYQPVVEEDDWAYVSGQLPIVEGVLVASGKVGGGVGVAQAKSLAEVAVVNALAALSTSLGDLSRISRIVKLTGFVASDPSFTGQSEVINGASDLLETVLGESGIHARSAVGVLALPKDSPVEIELIVKLKSGS